jgi:predicted ArsR family transcriptional regulator
VDPESIAAVAALDDAVRRALFTCVRAAPGPMTREAAAAEVGISRKLAAFHLDKLVDAGLLRARIQQVGTPRVGRAPKVYEPSGRDVEVRVPQREYSLLADILLSVVLEQRPGERAADTVLRVARERGESEGDTARAQARPGRLGAERAITLVERLLRDHGFEPGRDGDGVRLRNCPFHPHAEAAPEVVCSMNHAYICGLLHGLGADASLQAVLRPVPGECCVRVQRS